MRNWHHCAVQPRQRETILSAVRGCAVTMANGCVGTDATRTSEDTFRSMYGAFREVATCLQDSKHLITLALHPELCRALFALNSSEVLIRRDRPVRT